MQPKKKNKIISMVKLYHFFQTHKWVLYLTLGLTTILFVILGLQCRFEENIAKLLPPTGDNMTVDLAFSDLKVKDKIFVQAVAKGEADVSQEQLAEAMDNFMFKLTELDADNHNIENTLYEIDLLQLLDIAPYLLEHAPAYLDFTDHEMDSLTSKEHLSMQVAQYLGFMDTELGMQLYDYIAYDPAGILMSRVNSFLPQADAADNSQKSASPAKRLHNNHLFSADGKVCQAFITPNLSSMDSGTAGRLLQNIKKAKKQTETELADVEILYHGTVIQSANNAHRIKTDLLYTIGAALIIILLLLGWCFRQPSTNLLVLLPILYGAAFALAGMWVTKGGMSVMALGIGAIVLGVALSYCLHVMVHFKYVGNAEQTVREQAKPVFLGALTTIGAFAGLLFTSSSLLQDFGLFAVFAMIGTTAASLMFMPQFFPKQNIKNERAFAFLERINNAEIDRKPWVLAIMGFMLCATIPFSGKVTFDSDLKHINYTEPDVLRSRLLWEEKNNEGYFQQYFASVDTTLDAALENLTNIENRCAELQAEGKIAKYSKTSALMPSVAAQEERIAHWQQYFTPQRSREIWKNVETACRENGIEADMFLPFQEAMTAQYEPSLIADEQLIPQALLSNLVEKVGDNYLVFLPVKMPAENINEVNGLLTALPRCLVLDPFYYTIDTVAMMNDDFNTILGISALFVLLVLIFSFRRFTIALIAFLPMTLSWYVVLGAMYLTGHEFNLINIVVSSFIFGIGVDYSIFIMDGLLAKAKGQNPKLLAYHKTAITISATILVICMFSLLFAQHPAIQSIGFASLVGMISTMLLAYTLEPWLFRLCLKSNFLRQRILK